MNNHNEMRKLLNKVSKDGHWVVMDGISSVVWQKIATFAQVFMRNESE